jgi:Zn-dependent peptidase ImmA (M78 family)
MLNKRIERITVNILEELNINKLPIPIDEIVAKRGLIAKSSDLGNGVSGILVINKGIGTIGYSHIEPQVRQRFTIAHEFGHYELHRQDNDLFIDKEFKALFRDHNSSTGEMKREQEANAFAAAILMPERLLIKEIKKHNFDLSDDDSMKELAKLFDVSTPAMTYRIANLNLFWKYGF